MKFRRNKKGFTMVELIIVIAVIAVLTAILVPTFIHLANKAGDASDKTIVKNANTQLALKAAQGRRNTSMSEAVKDVDEIGYHMSGVSTSNGNQICWDRLNDRFVLFNKDNQIIYADGERTVETFADFFKPVSNFDDAGEFTPYAKQGFDFGESGVSLSEEGTLTLGARSFDVGELEDVTTVIVEDTSATATGTYLVGTGNTGVTVNVNVPNGTVYHLGIAREVNITGIAGDSYHEFGRIGFAEMASTGRYVAEKGAEVKALWFSANAQYTKKSGATVNEYASNETIEHAIENQTTNDADVIIPEKSKEAVRVDAINEITKEINKEEGIEGNPITNEKEFEAALTASGSYYLANDINITSGKTTGANLDIVIDLHGCKINLGAISNPADMGEGDCVISVYRSSLVFDDTVGGGMVRYITSDIHPDAVIGVLEASAKLTINGGTFLSATEDGLFGGVVGKPNIALEINGGTIYGHVTTLVGTIKMNCEITIHCYDAEGMWDDWPYGMNNVVGGDGYSISHSVTGDIHNFTATKVS